jgi:sugar phosphate isomerase/epimerase
LYADIHLAHTLRDAITLAEMAGVGICIDVFHCWTEPDFEGLVRRALPRTELIQLSDYVLGDRALPARAVPGDGAIPLEAFLAQSLAGGYSHGFDLELIGPRIEEEGRFESARRACAVVGEMLNRLGA